MKICLKGSVMTAGEIYSVVSQLASRMKDVLVGGTGGLMMYFVEHRRMKERGVETKIDLGSMFVNIFMGSFVAYVIGGSISPDTPYRDGIIAVIGMCSYSIIGLLESRVTQWVVDVFMAVLGGNKDGKK